MFERCKNTRLSKRTRHAYGSSNGRARLPSKLCRRVPDTINAITINGNRASRRYEMSHKDTGFGQPPVEGANGQSAHHRIVCRVGPVLGARVREGKCVPLIDVPVR